MHDEDQRIFCEFSKAKNNFCRKDEWGEFHALMNFILKQTSVEPSYDIMSVLNENFD